MWGRRLCEAESSRQENLRRPGKSKVIESLTTSLLCTISIKGQNTKILCWEFEQTGKSKVTEIVLRFKWPGLKYITNYHVQYFLLLQT